jgi:hypothetical protein
MLSYQTRVMIERIRDVAYLASWKEANPGKFYTYTRKWAINNNEHVRKLDRSWAHRRRQAVFDHYGHACACCGEDREAFLTIDHINGGGHKHLKSIGGTKLYVWLYRNGFPEGYRTLCMNCNWALGIHGYCPHQTKEA